LIVLGKSAHPACITHVDFFFKEDQLSIVAGDEDGVIRIYEYDPLSGFLILKKIEDGY